MNTLTKSYFLKALDNYPQKLDEFLDQINYSISYDENNPDAHYLLGRFYMEQLSKYDLAKYHFEIALSNDINHIQTYYYFIRWSIDTEDYKLALKLIKYAENIQGISKDTLLHRRATIAEKKHHYKKAERLINSALEISIFNNNIDFFKNERTRIQEKRSRQKMIRLKQKKL